MGMDTYKDDLKTLLEKISNAHGHITYALGHIDRDNQSDLETAYGDHIAILHGIEACNLCIGIGKELKIGKGLKIETEQVECTTEFIKKYCASENPLCIKKHLIRSLGIYLSNYEDIIKERMNKCK